MIEPYVAVLDPQLMEQVKIIATGIVASFLVGSIYASPAIVLLKFLNEKSGNYSKHLG
jgi:hypothetical protein